jgi:ubiquinone/menaquinone biosynthesis C-methylase UbiE
MSESKAYLHGFNAEEQSRLYRQALFLENVVYPFVDLSSCKHILETGCGVGAQTEILVRRFPKAKITGIDFSTEQILAAQEHFSEKEAKGEPLRLMEMDATQMQFDGSEGFDGAFLCWVLEHIPQPERVLAELKRVLKPGSPIFISEVLNHTLYLEPASPAIMNFWNLFNTLQLKLGGNPFVGARLGTLLEQSGYAEISIHNNVFYYDRRMPEKRKAMFLYFEELMMSAVPGLLRDKLVTAEMVNEVRNEIRQLLTNPESIFYFVFIQAKAKS